MSALASLPHTSVCASRRKERQLPAVHADDAEHPRARRARGGDRHLHFEEHLGIDLAARPSAPAAACGRSPPPGSRRSVSSGTRRSSAVFSARAARARARAPARALSNFAEPRSLAVAHRVSRRPSSGARSAAPAVPRRWNVELPIPRLQLPDRTVAVAEHGRALDRVCSPRSEVVLEAGLEVVHVERDEPSVFSRSPTILSSPRGADRARRRSIGVWATSM